MITATAPSNIALVKYWGKRNKALNLPLTSSLSLTLRSLWSEATVEESSTGQDEWDIMGDPSKAQRVLAEARGFTKDDRPLRVSIQNHFPSGAGLASSASSMAAFSRALAQFLADGSTPLDEMARWSRLGSGSSVRSLLTGYVLWDAGTEEDGSDCRISQAFTPEHFPLSLVVCVVNDKPKPIGSTAAMERCRDTSPNYQEFHERNGDDLKAALSAIENRDLMALAEVAEANCLAMHDVMHKATPPVNYFMEGTHKSIALTRELRASGVPCFFSIDAGPNVKIFCPPEQHQAVVDACKSITELVDILEDPYKAPSTPA